jgi:hypothetical protein
MPNNLTQQTNAGRVGRSAEHLAAAWLLANNNVYVSMVSDPSEVDMVVLPRGANPITVQVKTAYIRQDGDWIGMVANCARSSGERYCVDYLLVVVLSTFEFYLIPTAAITEKSRIRVFRYGAYRHYWGDAARW